MQQFETNLKLFDNVDDVKCYRNICKKKFKLQKLMNVHD